ncbi:MAG: aminotransferase class IV [Saprospiraceae bacterium]
MSLLVESIKIINGKVLNIDQHQMRFDRTRYILFGVNNPINLRKHIQIPEQYQKGLVKCRVEYQSTIQSISYSNYQIRNIQKLKLVVASEPFDYQYKFVHRPELDALYSLRGDCDEIIIVQNGLVTDAYYYNVVFQCDDTFVTPEFPILCGTQRAKLLNKGQIKTGRIFADRVKEFEYIHLINALTPLGEIKVNIENLNLFQS